MFFFLALYFFLRREYPDVDVIKAYKIIIFCLSNFDTDRNKSSTLSLFTYSNLILSWLYRKKRKPPSTYIKPNNMNNIYYEIKGIHKHTASWLQPNIIKDYNPVTFRENE